MSTTNDTFQVLYKINLNIILDDNTTLNISSSDIVSISIINNYDSMYFPIIRLRLYSDVENILSIVESVDSIRCYISFSGGVYRINSDESSPTIVKPTNPMSFNMKGYIENKNIPTSTLDQYENGIKKTTDLNKSVKAPIEIYCYDETLIHRTKQNVSSIYKDISLQTLIESIFKNANIYKYQIDTPENQNKYAQILIPNLNLVDTLSFIESRYGIYKRGGQIYGDYDKIYIVNSDINNNSDILPIYIESIKNNSNTYGLKKINDNYNMMTLANSVSVITETDVERVLRSPDLVAINLNTLKIETRTMQKLYSEMVNNSENYLRTTIENLLHKNVNEYMLDTFIARVNEKMTKVDISGNGFDIAKMKINTRYNLVFTSTIRGLNINEYYRATYTCHTFANLSADLFVASTTMNLCSN